MRRWKWVVGGLAVLAVVAAVVAMAIAQPPPPGWAPASGAGGWGQGQGQGRGQVGRMGQQAARTPEEAAQQRLDMLVQLMGGQISLTDQDKQALTQCLKEQEAIRQELRQKLQALGQAVRQQGADADIAQRLAEYRTAMQAAQTRKATAEQTLTNALNLAQRPKLDAALLIFGILDNGMPSGGGMGMAGGRQGRQGKGGQPGGAGPGTNPMPAQPPQGR